jgi:hypothetical protein
MTSLVTDDKGKKILIDNIGLEFEFVSKELNSISSYHQNWWALGKIIAYKCQKSPFIHIDQDVILWKKIPENIEKSDVFTQSIEYVGEHDHFYAPRRFDELKSAGGWVPEEILEYLRSPYPHSASNCGIFGGNNIQFIQHYANNAIKFVTDPYNITKWEPRWEDNVLMEQYNINACVNFHRGKMESPFKNVKLDYLFPVTANPYDMLTAEEYGYTHLMDAKKNPFIAAIIEERVKSDYPKMYKRCFEYVNDNKNTEKAVV